MSSLIGAAGVFAVVLGVLGFFVLSFIGSSDLVSSTARSALARDDVRRVVAEELVNKLEEGGDNGAKIVIHVARSKVVDAVEISLGNSKLREVAGDVASTAYAVFIEGKPRETVNIQPFADAAFEAIRLTDPFMLQDLSPRVNPLEISRSDSSPNFARIRTWALIAPWVLAVGGLVLLGMSWFLSVAGKWLWLRRVGILIFVGGGALILLAYFARTVTFSDDTSGRISEALVLFFTSRLLMWSVVLAAIGVVVTLLGAIMNRRVMNRQSSRSE
ncbi:MAG: hypothetical protein ACYC06_11480 [Ilumatobacteraceae bacterium]